MSYCSFAQAIEGLHACYATVLEPDGILCLAYEPMSVQDAPLLYSLLVSFERSQTGQVTTMRYRVLSRLILQWQDSEQAEAQLMSYVNALPAAVEADPTLGARISMGLARVTEGQTGMLEVSSSKYRIFDLYADIVTKAAQGSGI